MRLTLFIFLFLVLTLPLTLFGYLTGTDSGFVWAWRGLDWASWGTIKAEQVSGNLWQGFQLHGLQLRTLDEKIYIDHLQLNWAPQALWQRQLWIKQLTLGAVNISSTSTAPGRWPEAPSSLMLPLKLRIDELSLTSLTGLPLAIHGFKAAYDYDGMRHLLTIKQLRTQTGQFSSQLTLADQAPFRLLGSLKGQSALGAVTLKITGSLLKLDVAATLIDHQAALNISLQGQTTPFASKVYRRIQGLKLKTIAFNPQRVHAHWPNAKLNIAFSMTPNAQGVQGTVTLNNDLAGPFSSNQLPLKQVNGHFFADEQQVQIDTFITELLSGTMAITGTLDLFGNRSKRPSAGGSRSAGTGMYTDIHEDSVPRLTPDHGLAAGFQRGLLQNTQLKINAQLNRIALPTLLAELPNETVSGQVNISGTLHEPTVNASLHGQYLSADTELISHNKIITLKQLTVRAGPGELNLNGQIDAQQRFHLNGKLQHANPARLYASWPSGDINAQVSATGHISAQPSLNLTLQMLTSRVLKQALSGTLNLQWAKQRLESIYASLQLANNRLEAQGAYGAPGNRLKIKVDAPDLSHLGSLFAGSLQAQLDLSGLIHDPTFTVSAQARNLQLPGHVSLRDLTLEGSANSGPQGRLALVLQVSDLAWQQIKAQSLQVKAQGRFIQHQLSIKAQSVFKNSPYTLAFNAMGAWHAAQHSWHATVTHLALTGRPSLTLLSSANVIINPEKIALGPCQFALAHGIVHSTGFTRRNNGDIQSTGTVTGIQLADFSSVLPASFSSDLTLNGDWNIAKEQGELHLIRQGGDGIIKSAVGASALGLKNAALDLSWKNQQVRFALQLDSQLATIRAQGHFPHLAAGINRDTVVISTLKAHLPDLSVFSALTGQDTLLGGTLNADLALNGSLSTRIINGTLNGENLLWQDRKTAIRLANGTLALRVEGKKMQLEQLRFASDDGDINAQGSIDLSGNNPAAQINIRIHHFSIFNRPDRHLVVSGESTLSVTATQMTLTGHIHADSGRMNLPPANTPVLSDDVIIKGHTPPASAFSRLPLYVTLTLDLGSHFRFVGEGLDVALTGQVKVRTEPKAPPTAQGQVKISSGRYSAYGQELDIAKGSITFVGNLDNPVLNIRAQRHLSPVGAGVEVTGPLATPTLRLIADDDLSDNDKLSWLILGRPADENGQDNNLLALAAGPLNKKIGLFDDMGVVRRQSRQLSDGTISPAEQMITLGKQLTQSFYLGYQYGLSSAEQSVKMMYQLSKAWSLIFYVGNDTSAETRYSVRFD